MTKHSNGPWHVGGDGTIIYGKDGWGVASATVFHVRQEPVTSQANARRIVACVNACEGLSTERLEDAGLISAIGGELLDQDRIIADLRSVIDKIYANAGESPEWIRAAIDAAKAGDA